MLNQGFYLEPLRLVGDGDYNLNLLKEVSTTDDFLTLPLTFYFSFFRNPYVQQKKIWSVYGNKLVMKLGFPNVTRCAMD